MAYHRLYHTLILFFFIVLVFKGFAYPNVWNLNKREQTVLLVIMALIPPFLILPARIVNKVVPDYYGTISDTWTSVFFAVMLFFSMFLVRRFLQNAETETILERAASHDIPNDSHREAQPRWVNNP